jgi:hypothetical protein
MPTPSLDDRLVLCVRHGSGRGRHPRYLQGVFDGIRRRHADVAERLVVHETGGLAPDLDRVRAVVFFLADPLREHFPECFSEARAVADAAHALGLRVVNAPEAWSNTIKSTQSAIWHDHGVPTPVQRRLADRDDLEDALAEVEGPTILRPDDEHAQHGLRVCATRAELEAAARTFTFPGVIAPLVDARAGFAARAPGSLFGRYHHKKRALVLGDRVLPNELFFSSQPIVASETCTFHRYAGRRSLPNVLARVLPLERRCIAADIAYASGGPVPEDLLRRAVQVLGLDIAAVDYADTADGGAVLWEANPHFLLPPPNLMYLSRARRMAGRYEAVTDAFATFFRGL